MKGSVIRKAVSPARLGLDGLPVGERKLSEIMQILDLHDEGQAFKMSLFYITQKNNHMNVEALFF